MHIEERLAAAVMAEPLPRADGLGWFVARQPGILRHLEHRLDDDDRLAAALAFAWRLCAAFERAHGCPPPRIPSQELERAEVAVAREVRQPGPEGGLSVRQPELSRHLAGFLEQTRAPIEAALALAAILYCLDQADRDEQLLATA
jgi:hypothetical protein